MPTLQIYHVQVVPWGVSSVFWDGGARTFRAAWVGSGPWGPRFAPAVLGFGLVERLLFARVTGRAPRIA